MSSLLSCIAIVLSLFAIFQKNSPIATVNSQKVALEEPKFEDKMINLVNDCISYNQQLQSKGEILDLLDEVRERSYYLQTGSDDFRSKFVHSQASFEHVMACYQALGEITDLAGVIHTPTPATPLCIEPNESITQGLLDQSIQWDLNKLLTVRSRAQIVREYLMKGGILYAAYPQGGLEKRSQDQQNVYFKALSDYKGRLIDTVLTCDEMHEDMIGATYLFKNRFNQTFAFSIKARQANDVQAKSEWGLWFGEVTDPTVKNRIDIIFDYLKTYNGPDLRENNYYRSV